MPTAVVSFSQVVVAAVVAGGRMGPIAERSTGLGRGPHPACTPRTSPPRKPRAAATAPPRPLTGAAALMVVVMTWVVAHANPIAVVMMSDIRISVGTTEVPQFGVKKIHRVAPTVFAGFAGSVILGFRLIGDLTAYLTEHVDPTASTISLAEGWAGALPSRVRSFVSEDLGSLRTDLVIAGMHLVSVNDPDGMPTAERMPFGAGCIVRLPEPMNGGAELERFSWNSAGVSVGSGSQVPAYGQMLRELDWVQLSGWEDPALAMTAVMNLTIESTPIAGVSADLVAMVMKYTGHEIVGVGRTVGDIASNRALMAENEDEFAALWETFGPGSGALMAVSSTELPQAAGAICGHPGWTGSIPHS